ncbi:hypothetical protein L5515_000841 [Caenorhabditis briggsae]|nr:hypothetical protein L3Y34_014766 [Caenorhabditis briggsae]UMM11674.1 hypothetical protein L5515_000841 [Caenorhabditis briggsae]
MSNHLFSYSLENLQNSMSSTAFDGEAPETDDETEEEIFENTQVGSASAKREESHQKFSSVDRKLERRWTQVATGAIQICRNRCMNEEKTMQKVIESAAEYFTSMQTVAAKLNVVHTNVTRLEDSVADLLEASKLIPNKCINRDLNIPEFF